MSKFEVHAGLYNIIFSYVYKLAIKSKSIIMKCVKSKGISPHNLLHPIGILCSHQTSMVKTIFLETSILSSFV